MNGIYAVVAIAVGFSFTAESQAACVWDPHAGPGEMLISSGSESGSGSYAIASSIPYNVGIYEWSDSQQLWVRVSTHLVEGLLFDYEPEAGDVLLDSGGGGGDDDGGGGAVEPHSCDEVVLPTVTVTAPAPASSGSFLSVVTSFSSGGGWRLWRSAPIEANADAPVNTFVADCTSSSMDRGEHAAQDFHHWRVNNFTSTVRAGRGETITVTYDDGGTERYTWIEGRIPSATSPWSVFLARVPGSLQCP